MACVRPGVLKFTDWVGQVPLVQTFPRRRDPILGLTRQTVLAGERIALVAPMIVAT